MRSTLRSLPWVISAVLIAAATPLAHFAGLPQKYHWVGFCFWYAGMMVEAVVIAAFLYMAGEPADALKLLRMRGPAIGFPWKEFAAVAVPAICFFLGSLLITEYNDIIATLKFSGGGDALLTRADSWLLLGGSVASWSHRFLARFPGAFEPMEILYFILSPVIGACVLILGCARGIRRSMEFLGAVLMGYYVSLFFFWLAPATGPYFTCPAHFSAWPSGSLMYSVQISDAAKLTRFQAGLRPPWITTDYFMAFPCMHVVQPVLIWWFLREFRGIARIMVAYNIVLIPSILLLEQHYVVDILSGFVLSAILIVAFDGWPVQSRSNEHGALRQ